MPLPPMTTGAYKVLALAIIFIGVVNLFPQDPRFANSYHRFPEGKIAGTCYIILGVIMYIYQVRQKRKNKA
jgi:hypothetical protein